jgi:hypothetical protein
MTMLDIFLQSPDEIKSCILNLILLHGDFRPAAILTINVHNVLILIDIIMPLFPDITCQLMVDYIHPHLQQYVAYKHTEHQRFIELSTTNGRDFAGWASFLGHFPSMNTPHVAHVAVLSLYADFNGVLYLVYEQTINQTVSTRDILNNLVEAKMLLAGTIPGVVAEYVTRIAN